MTLSNILLHPTVSNPEQLAALMDLTNLVPVQSNRTRNIILISHEAVLIREALMSVDYDNEPSAA